MKFKFDCGTGTWLEGKALAVINPKARYTEPNSSYQIVEAQKVEADMEKMNEAMKEISLIGGSSDEYLFDQDKFDRLKDYLRDRGEVVEESNSKIVVEEK